MIDYNELLNELEMLIRRVHEAERQHIFAERAKGLLREWLNTHVDVLRDALQDAALYVQLQVENQLLKDEISDLQDELMNK